jgi:tetratricopeptide (TPR) repeat protein
LPAEIPGEGTVASTRQLTEAEKNAAKFLVEPPLAGQIVRNAQASRAVIQDFVPLADSLEWQLGQQYLRERGNKAFISDAIPVPFVINNDGTLSRKAAEVFFTSLVEAEKTGDLEERIFVLELGVGVGLFASFFLDCFEELCDKHRKDFYERLCYVAADKSERMLLDMCRHGIFSNHPGRYCIRVVDALSPEKELPHDALFLNQKGKPFRAVFLNYLLDCLPAAALMVDGDDVKQLCVRTCVARGIQLEDVTDMTLPYLQQRAKSTDPRARQELLEVYGFFASEYDYRPVTVKQVPYGAFACDFIRSYGKRVMHNYGAIQCLERLLDLIDPQGFILMNEYGQTQIHTDDELEHQRFSLTTAVGLNFPLLKAFFEESQERTWLEPKGEERGIQTRLLGHTPAHATVVAFHEHFRTPAFAALNAPIEKARECIKAGRFEMAATFYDEAIELQPHNWVLLSEVSTFLTFQLRNPKAGADLAKVALGHNPACSSDLWNTLGDALFQFGRTREARSAYEQALALNTADIRSRYSLAWVCSREKDHRGALIELAEAFELDRTGQYRDRLIEKQKDVLARLAAQHQQDYLLLLNLVSKSARTDNDKPRRDSMLELPHLT